MTARAASPQSTPPKSRLLGTGSFLPPVTRTNTDLEKLVDTNDTWIRERTGIRERRVAPEGMVTSDMAAEAAKRALEAAELSPRDLDLIVVATVTPDMPMPATAVFVQQKLGATCAAFESVRGVRGLHLRPHDRRPVRPRRRCEARARRRRRALVARRQLGQSHDVRPLRRRRRRSNRRTRRRRDDARPERPRSARNPRHAPLLRRLARRVADDPRRRQPRADGRGAPPRPPQQGPHEGPGHLQGGGAKLVFCKSEPRRRERPHERVGRLGRPAPGQRSHHRPGDRARELPEGKGPLEHRARRQHVERVESQSCSTSASATAQ